MTSKRLSLLTIAVPLLLAAAPVAEAAKKAPTFTNRAVTVKVRASQKTTWTAVPVADPGCMNKAGGFRGSGTETIEWSHSRALKGTLTGSGESWGLTLRDKRGAYQSTIPIAGSIERKGGGVSVVCGEDRPDTSGGCVGRRAFATEASLQFLTRRRFTMSDDRVTGTSSLYPDCDWVWDSLTVRTGNVLLNVGKGKYDPKRLAARRSSVTLIGRDESTCREERADPGVECTTVTDWRITLYPAGRRR